MIRLADLERLPRPGSGGFDDHWFGFRHDPQVAQLGWPELVVEQFLFDHGNDWRFVQQYGHLDLTAIEWTLELLSARVLATVTGSERSLVGRVEECAVAPSLYIGMRPVTERQQWDRAGTWIKPPLVVTAALLDPPREGLHIVEGHTRLGILQRRLASGQADPDASHEVYVGAQRS